MQGSEGLSEKSPCAEALFRARKVATVVRGTIVDKAVVPRLEQPLTIEFLVGVNVAAEYHATVAFQVAAIFVDVPVTAGRITVDFKQAGAREQKGIFEGRHHLLPEA